jgi:hypothetical protein
MIATTAEPGGMGTLHERCCFCREPTRRWTNLPERKPGEQVACCESCAKEAKTEDVPAKEVWCRRERIASPTFLRMQRGG